MILVIGATGNVGRQLVDRLCEAQEAVRIVTRDPRRATKWHGLVELVVGDVRDPEVRRRAMREVDRMFALSFVDAPDTVDRQVTEDARAAGVRHITKLSTIGATTPIPIGQRHRLCEDWVRASGIPWTFLRPGFFMTNTLRWASAIRDTGQVTVPAPDGPIAPISEYDIAEVAFRSLVDTGHDGRIHSLTGDTLLTAREQIAILSEVLDRRIECHAADIEQTARRFGEAGQPEWLVASLRAMWEGVQAGTADQRTATFRELTGRSPMSYAEWSIRHVADFR